MISIQNTCFYSSFIFIINVLVALFYEHYLYASLFGALLITSLFYHCHYTPLTNAIDKIAIVSVVFYGGWFFFTKLLYSESLLSTKQLFISFIIVLSFLCSGILYYYGYRNTCFCFCDDPIQANLFHSLMHCVVCLSHYCIIIL